MKFCLYSTFISNQWTKKRVIVASEVMIVMRLGTYGCHLFMVHDSALCFFEKNIYCKLHTVIRLYLYIYPSIYEYLFMYIYIYTWKLEPLCWFLHEAYSIHAPCPPSFLSSGFGEMERDSLLLGVGWTVQDDCWFVQCFGVETDHKNTIDWLHLKQSAWLVFNVWLIYADI